MVTLETSNFRNWTRSTVYCPINSDVCNIICCWVVPAIHLNLCKIVLKISVKHLPYFPHVLLSVLLHAYGREILLWIDTHRNIYKDSHINPNTDKHTGRQGHTKMHWKIHKITYKQPQIQTNVTNRHTIGDTGSMK